MITHPASCVSECKEAGSRQQPPARDPQHADGDGGWDGGQHAGGGPGHLPDHAGGSADLAAVGRGRPADPGRGVRRRGRSQGSVSHTRGRRRGAGRLLSCRGAKTCRHMYTEATMTVLFHLWCTYIHYVWLAHLVVVLELSPSTFDSDI